jgi:hypothetical protein
MKQILLQEKFPIFKLEVDKSETEYKSAQEVINYFKQLIDDHDVTRFIAEFDHYSHTKGLQNGLVDEGIIDARNIIFCFGTQLPKAEVLAVRPRSIGIAETINKIIVTFMEAPMAVANETMEFWVKSLVNHELEN